jgi:thymidylate synthase
MINATIANYQEYAKYLWSKFDSDPVGDTHEVQHVSLEFTGKDQLGYCDSIYQNAVWNVVSSYNPPNLAPSVNDLTVLDFYRKNEEGWFDGDTARVYGYEIFNQLPDVQTELSSNSATRRAVIRMPADACLLSVQFTFRLKLENERLVPVFTTVGNFRSSDAVYGLPADFWILRKLTDLVMPKSTHPCVSRVIIHAESLHVYDEDVLTVMPGAVDVP